MRGRLRRVGPRVDRGHTSAARLRRAPAPTGPQKVPSVEGAVSWRAMSNSGAGMRLFEPPGSLGQCVGDRVVRLEAGVHTG